MRRIRGRCALPGDCRGTLGIVPQLRVPCLGITRLVGRNQGGAVGHALLASTAWPLPCRQPEPAARPIGGIAPVSTTLARDQLERTATGAGFMVEPGTRLRAADDCREAAASVPAPLPCAASRWLAEQLTEQRRPVADECTPELAEIVLWADDCGVQRCAHAGIVPFDWLGTRSGGRVHHPAIRGSQK